MLSLRQPRSEDVFALLETLQDSPYSYAAVGATDGKLPDGYTVDRYQQVIGQGQPAFEAARQAIRDWAPFRIPWIRTYPQGPPAPNCVVAVVARAAGLWWTNVARVVYAFDEPTRSGFAYGTLPYHAETGEERFSVEIDPATGAVTYSVLAFSRPRHPLARLGYPLSRRMQKRFGAQTLQAMQQAVADAVPAPPTQRNASV